jgi:hypothetical protein
MANMPGESQEEPSVMSAAIPATFFNLTFQMSHVVSGVAKCSYFS